jgi:L-ascorbate metabolism protein UlaG (beta-lactamase superfamily)
MTNFALQAIRASTFRSSLVTVSFVIHPMLSAFQKDDVLLADIQAASGDDLHLWWLGQSGFMLKQAGAFVLIDPYLSDSLTLKYASTDKPHVRMTERCIAPERLGFVKLVLSSHQHTDHFDEATLSALGDYTLLTPAALESKAKQRLPREGIEWIGVSEHDHIERHGWVIRPLAAAHNEIVRDEIGRSHYLGFIAQRNGITIYHSGDTLWHEELLPSLLEHKPDIVLVPINGNKPERRVAGNLNGTEAAALAKACGAKLAVPHHFDMFEFNTESPDEFVTACARLHQPQRVLRCGERLSHALP